MLFLQLFHLWPWSHQFGCYWNFHRDLLKSSEKFILLLLQKKKKTLIKMSLYLIHSPQVWFLKEASRRTNTCITGVNCTSTWTPKLVSMIMKNDEGLNMVTLATHEKQNGHFLNKAKRWKHSIVLFEIPLQFLQIQKLNKDLEVRGIAWNPQLLKQNKNQISF